MKRLFDLVLALVAAVFLVLPIAAVAVAVRLTSPGPALYWSDRVGRHNRIFRKIYRNNDIEHNRNFKYKQKRKKKDDKKY